MGHTISNCRPVCVFRLLGLWMLLAIANPTVFASPVAKTRNALVIGNARYEQTVGMLRNTNNDAKAVAQTLRSLGFAVIERHDVTRDQLIRSMEEFRKLLPGTEVALFYYAGHGISVSGSNYLIPLKSGFDPAGSDEVTVRMLAETRLFNAEQAVADMSTGGAGCNLVILDACRTTPLMRSTRTRGFAEHAGLSEMTPPAGSLIAFATDAGRTAFDGDGANGLYTEELLKNLRTPGLTVEQVFKRTRAGVLARSDGGQLPAEYSRLFGDDIYLAGTVVPKPVTAPVAPVSPIAENIPATPPAPEELVRLAEAGKGEACLKGVKLIADSKGPGEYAVKPLEALLEFVKNTLKEASVPSSKVVSSAEICESILRVLPESLPRDHPQTLSIASRAHNRRGDALLILGRAHEAVPEFDAALSLAPSDAYILYNRGRAYLALGKKDEAKADFLAVSDSRFNQQGARRLALRALAGME